MNVERSFKEKRGEQCSKDEVLRETDLRREGQGRENDPGRNQSDAVRKTNSPRQHRDHTGDQKKEHSRLKIEVHAFPFSLGSPRRVNSAQGHSLRYNYLATSVGPCQNALDRLRNLQLLQWVPRSFAFFAKGRSRKCRLQVGSLTYTQQNQIAHAASPPTLQKRKDEPPSVGTR